MLTPLFDLSLQIRIDMKNGCSFFFSIVQKEEKDRYSSDIKGFFFEMVQGCIG